MQINWKITLFSACFFLVFLRLGFWQLERAGAKERLLAEREAAQAADPLPITEVAAKAAPTEGTRVTMIGHYRDEIYLLDNRVLDGVVGFEVLMVFDADGLEAPVLVNRGFVAMKRLRTQLPDVPPIRDTGRATGKVHVYEPSTASAEPLAPGAWIVQAPASAASRVPGVWPYVVRLADDDPNALPRYWPDTVMLPSQHRGYAVQWFLMAVAVAVMWAYFTVWRKREESDGD